MATVGGVSIPVPIAIRERVSRCAVRSTLAIAVADAVGVKRSVTTWVAPRPTRPKGFPETTLKGAEVDTVPETIPPPVFDTVKTRSMKLPRFTLPKFTVPVGLTAISMRATAAPKGAAQALSSSLAFTAVTATW